MKLKALLWIQKHTVLSAYTLNSTCSKSIESRNHTSAEVGRSLLRSSSPIPLLKQGQPEEGAQDSVQSCFEYTPQPLWTTCSSVWPPKWLLTRQDTLKHCIQEPYIYIYPFWISICLASFTLWNLKWKHFKYFDLKNN